LNVSSATGNPRITLSDTFDSVHKVRRWFIDIPAGSSAGVIRLARLDENDVACEFKVSICMPQPRSGLTTGQQETTWPLITLNRCGRGTISSGRPRSGGRRMADDFDGAVQLAFAIPWEADYLELTIAQHWGLEPPATVIGELYFRGLEPNGPHLFMVLPSESRIFYLGHGQDEVLVNNCGCYTLRLVYRFTCPFKSAVSHFELPWLQELLYDSDYLVQLYNLYDWRGRFIGSGDYDLKRQKKQKFAFTLERGDYKVVVQICHEQGTRLSSAHGKLGSRGREGTNPSEPPLDKSSPTMVANGPEPPGPLERLRNHPALVRFRLPVGAGAADRASTPSGNPVSFEFAAFAFSLGLNGSKPCSALDPIPYRRPGNEVPSVQAFDHNSDCIQTEKRGELNRRCPCLPTNLAAKESTSIFVGICDERYVVLFLVSVTTFAVSVS
uniref:TPPII domain-containing protein n=1 Tax=Echinostoma caproni TaxID=27848 RepID=A0A183AZI9_9TREM